MLKCHNKSEHDATRDEDNDDHQGGVICLLNWNHPGGSKIITPQSALWDTSIYI